MARKITQKAKDAFNFGYNFHETNTRVENNALYLWGNKILWKNERGNICFSLCGWDTPTTCERLRAFLPLTRKKGVLYWENTKINEYKKYELSHEYADGIKEINE